MQMEILFDNIEKFIDTLKELNIDKIAFAETDEKRAEQMGPDLLQVVKVVRVDLIAYKNSVIYKCTLNNIDLNSLYKRLESEGFNLIRRNRNIT